MITKKQVDEVLIPRINSLREKGYGVSVRFKDQFRPNETMDFTLMYVAKNTYAIGRYAPNYRTIDVSFLKELGVRNINQALEAFRVNITLANDTSMMPDLSRCK